MTEEDAVAGEALLEAGEAVTVVVEVVVEDGEHLVADEVEQLAAQRVRRHHLCRLADKQYNMLTFVCLHCARHQAELAPRSSSSRTDTPASL